MPGSCTCIPVQPSGSEPSACLSLMRCVEIRQPGARDAGLRCKAPTRLASEPEGRAVATISLPQGVDQVGVSIRCRISEGMVLTAWLVLGPAPCQRGVG